MADPLPSFGDIFRISEAENTYVPWGVQGNTYTAEGSQVAQAMRDDLEKRGLTLDLKRGPLNEDGMMSAIFLSPQLPDAVVRIGIIDRPAQSAVLLKPAAALYYQRPDGSDGFQVHVVPKAPDAGEVTPSDIINTLRVLQAEGLLTKISDISPGQFVYLRGGDGDLVRYPDTVPDASMRGRPIAFIRDINAIRADAVEDLDGSASTEQAQFSKGARQLFDDVRKSLDSGTPGDGRVALKVFDDASDEMNNIISLGLKPKLDTTKTGIVLEGDEAMKLYNMRRLLSVDDLPPAPPEAVAAAAAAQRPFTARAQANLISAGINMAPSLLQGEFGAAATAETAAAPAPVPRAKAAPSV